MQISIGGLCFDLIPEDDPAWSKAGLTRDKAPIAIDAFLPFLTSGEPVDVQVRYRVDEQVEKYAIAVSPDGSEVEIRVPSWQLKNFTYVRGCLMFIPMEEVLLRHNRFFLHASFIASSYGGLLFTGDSGAGKSTQAELWRTYMGSTVINGDRAIVARAKAGKNGWLAYGSPYAGSSGYYVRRDEPVRAIVLLEKAVDNQVSTVSEAEAFRRLMLQISVDHSRTGDVERLCNLVAELIASVPVYRLQCTPDVRAVNALCDMLEEVACG